MKIALVLKILIEHSVGPFKSPAKYSHTTKLSINYTFQLNSPINKSNSYKENYNNTKVQFNSSAFFFFSSSTPRTARLHVLIITKLLLESIFDLRPNSSTEQFNREKKPIIWHGMAYNIKDRRKFNKLKSHKNNSYFI